MNCKDVYESKTLSSDAESTYTTDDESIDIETISTLTSSSSNVKEHQTALMVCGINHFAFTRDGLSSSLEVFFETLGDAGDAILSFMKLANSPPFSITDRANMTKTNLAEAVSKLKDTLKKKMKRREEKKKERLKRLEENKRLEARNRLQNDMAIARAECSNVAQLWREGHQ